MGAFSSKTRGGITEEEEEEEEESNTPFLTSTYKKFPKDSSSHLAYLIYFAIGVGFLLPSNAFTTAIDYFSFIYPGVNVNRILAAFRLVIVFLANLVVVFWARKSSAYVRINVGMILFVMALGTVPVLDVVFVKGRRGVYSAYYVTVAADGVCGVAGALVQSGIMGSAGELPERYMQAVSAGMGVSGVIVSIMRMVTKALYAHNAQGLRSSANLYFSISITVMAICLTIYNQSNKLPIIQYYNDLKMQAIDEEKLNKDSLNRSSVSTSTLCYLAGRIKWFGFGIALVYIVSHSIFPGPITEDVHSYILKDWYPILLIACYHVFDVLGRSMVAIYLVKNENIAIIGSIAMLLFYPLFMGCLQGPKLFRTEIPVMVLTCLLGLTNGYFSTLLLIHAPKVVPIQHSEAAAIVLVVFSDVGLSIGSILAWLWII